MGTWAGANRTRTAVFANRLRAGVRRNDQEPRVAGVGRTSQRMCQARPGDARPVVV